MLDFSDFEMTDLPASKPDSEITPMQSPTGQPNESTPSSNVIADNFPKILDLAGEVLEIKKMKVASEAILAKQREDRLSLIAEAEAYAKKKNADTTDIVGRFTLVRDMMRDFYAANTGTMTSEDFQKVITSIIEQMGKK
ncbi:MAG: hypothetical protein K2N35_07195 [Muribaculaceae bacterium]|nr:hypothetical protein [Muribaculaceae bacterium]